MAKKGAGKNRGKRKPKNRNKPKVQVAAAADLRLVSAHVDNWLQNVPEAAQALIDLGRDAAFTVLEIAKEKGNKELEELGRRLSATPPSFETNLDALRTQSVLDHLEAQQKEAKSPGEIDDFEITGGAIALFDPKRLMENLVFHGRPRKDPSRLPEGDLAWYGLPTNEPMTVRFVEDAPPEDADTVRLRLKVESGVVFVGPPESSDGPRLGAVRKDPFRTAIDSYLDRGRWMRLKPTTYAVFAQLYKERGLTIWLAKDPDVGSAEVLDIDRMHEIPSAAS